MESSLSAKKKKKKQNKVTDNYVVGANIAGFVNVADAMVGQGLL